MHLQASMKSIELYEKRMSMMICIMQNPSQVEEVKMIILKELEVS
jgi:hypothetical protein